MTIALAVVANNGLVIAADTQESYDGFWKADQTKILPVFGPTRGSEEKAQLVIGGAGNGDYIDAISQRLVETFVGAQSKEPKDIFLAMQQTLREFYREYVIPLAIAPEQRPHFGLLIVGI